jgi:hypothetical protein
MITEIVNDLKHILFLYKEKPYLPYWGEILVILEQLKKTGVHAESELLLYELESSHTVVYQPLYHKFCIKAPDLNIVLDQYSFINSLLQGRFWPKGS